MDRKSDSSSNTNLRALYIYKTAHGADPVEDHMKEFQEWDISPDFIGLELPQDNKGFCFRDMLRRSPATTLSLYFSFWIQRILSSQGSSNGSSSLSEYEAGRQFAKNREIPVEKIHRNRDTILEDYLTWRIRVRDTTLLALALIYVVVPLRIFWISISQFQSGFTLGILLKTILTTILIVVLLFVALTFFLKISSNFVDGIRGARDEWMYKKISEWCEENDRESALVIAGENHCSGLSELAEENGVEVQTQSAPSLENVEEDSFGLKCSVESAEGEGIASL